MLLRDLGRNLERLQLWLHNKHVQNKVPACMVETMGGAGATNNSQVSTIDLVTELHTIIADSLKRQSFTTGSEMDQFLHHARALDERLPMTFFRVRIGVGTVPSPNDQIRYIRSRQMDYLETMGSEPKEVEEVQVCDVCISADQDEGNQAATGRIWFVAKLTVLFDAITSAPLQLVESPLLGPPFAKVLPLSLPEPQLSYLCPHRPLQFAFPWPLHNTRDDIVRRDRTRERWCDSQAWAGERPGLRTGPNKKILEWLAAEEPVAKQLLVQIRSAVTQLLTASRSLHCRLCQSHQCYGAEKKKLGEWSFKRDKVLRRLAFAVSWAKFGTCFQCPEGVRCSGLRVASNSRSAKASYATSDTTRCPHEPIRAVMPGRASDSPFLPIFGAETLFGANARF
jgi:hypothetical protein